MSQFAVALSLVLSAQAASEQALPPRYKLQDYLPPISEFAHAGHENALAFVRAGGDDALPVTPPQVEIWAREDMRPVSVSIAFNWVWLNEGGERRPIWFARLRAAYNDRSIERFADSRECPGVQESLTQLDGLPALDPRVPTLPTPTARAVDFGGYLHDNTYRIRLRGLFEGGTYSDKLDITGGSTAPFARIVGESLERLAPCWRDAPPPRA